MHQPLFGDAGHGIDAEPDRALIEMIEVASCRRARSQRGERKGDEASGSITTAV